MIPAKITFRHIRSGFELSLIAFVLFYSALAFCLPVPQSEAVALAYPWWAFRIGIGNVVLHELLFMVWIALFGSRFVLRTLLNRGIPTRQAAHWLIALAIWCGLISLTTPLPLQDLGRSFRLLLNVALMFAAVRWTLKMGNLPLEMFILGFLVGTIINLVISFQYPLIVNGAMRLSGQNTPGVAMGIAIHLSAWLFFHTNQRKTQTLAVITAILCAFGCGISYSRIGWFAGAFGFMAWAYILIAARQRERIDNMRLKKTRRMWLPFLAFGLIVIVASSPGQENLRWIQTLVVQKLFSGGRAGDAHRASYFVGVAEIISKTPWGVGYSGFFDAFKATEIYRSGKVPKEVDYEANPHSAFLYYASAGGIPGAIMTIAVFVMLLNSMRCGLVSAMDRLGIVLFVCAVPPFLLIGLTVPYIFNSVILIVPVAIASGWGWNESHSYTSPTITKLIR